MSRRDDNGRELYRHFDASKRLLYVGISLCTISRLSQHRRSSRWANDIVYIEVERFPTKELAVEAEKQAIILENPIWNVIHKPVEESGGLSASTKGSRKSRHTIDLFDVSNVARCLRETTRLVSRTVNFAKNIRLSGSPETDTFVSLILDLKEGVLSDELRLKELFEVESPEPAPAERFRLIVQATYHEPGTIVDQCGFTLITPYWLSQMCERFLGRRDDFDNSFDLDIQPAVAEFTRMFESLEFETCLQVTPD
ncbi:GIY-YIG nuclease family protein [Pseudomonas sp. S2_D06]